MVALPLAVGELDALGAADGTAGGLDATELGAGIADTGGALAVLPPQAAAAAITPSHIGKYPMQRLPQLRPSLFFANVFIGLPNQRRNNPPIWCQMHELIVGPPKP